MFQWLLSVIKGWLKKPQAKKRPKRQKVEEWGEFYFKHSILDQLDEYFKILKTMKKADRDAYKLHSKLGAYIVPNSKTSWLEFGSDVSETFLETMPSFGMVVFGDLGRTDENFALSAVYFQKYAGMSRPMRLQRPKANDAEIYVLTAYFAEEKCPFDFGIAVTPGGSVEVLKVKYPERIRVRAKNRTAGASRGSTFTITRNNWAYGEFAEEWAGQHNETVTKFIGDLFGTLTKCHQRSVSCGLK